MFDSTLSLIGLGIFPTVLIMFIIMINAVGKKRKPFKKIAAVFALSAFSVIPAAIAEVVGEIYLCDLMGIDLDKMSLKNDIDLYLLYSFIYYILVVGVAEEACKFFTFKWMIFHDRAFDNTYDGIIYGAASALGFATLENLVYIFGSDDSLSTAVMRALLSIPLHAMTGIFMGYYFGVSKYRKYNNINTGTRPEIPAYIFSVAIHGLYDYAVTAYSVTDEYNEAFGGRETSGIFYIIMTAAIMAVCYAAIIVTIVRARKNTHNIYNRYYYEQLGGGFQDLRGGKTSDKWPAFFAAPAQTVYRAGGFDPRDPYSAYTPPPQSPPPFVGYGQPYGQGNVPLPPPHSAVKVSVRPAAPAEAICPFCGSKNPPGSNFCSVCGYDMKKNK